MVSFFHAGANAVGVGHVAGYRVEANRLCTHGRACNVKDLEQTHHCSPFKAFSRPLILLFINSREVWYSRLLRKTAALLLHVDRVAITGIGLQGIAICVTPGVSICRAKCFSLVVARPKPCCCWASSNACEKLISRALKPGVSALAMLLDNTSARLERTLSVLMNTKCLVE